MLGKTHMIAGMTIAGLYACSADTTSLPYITAAITAGAIGGLLPDIDHPNSKISHKLKPVSKIVNLLFSHRGLFHTPAFYIILWAIVIWQFSNPANILFINSLFLGVMSHLFLDAFESNRNSTIFPLEKKTKEFGKYKDRRPDRKSIMHRYINSVLLYRN